MTSVIQGSVILESLQVGTRLSGLNLRVREIYRFRQENPGPGQPGLWGVLEWEADEADAAEIATAFSEVLDQPGWYVDFRSDRETFVCSRGASSVIAGAMPPGARRRWLTPEACRSRSSTGPSDAAAQPGRQAFAPS